MVDDDFGRAVAQERHVACAGLRVHEADGFVLGHLRRGKAVRLDVQHTHHGAVFRPADVPAVADGHALAERAPHEVAQGIGAREGVRVRVVLHHTGDAPLARADVQHARCHFAAVFECFFPGHNGLDLLVNTDGHGQTQRGEAATKVVLRPCLSVLVCVGTCGLATRQV